MLLVRTFVAPSSIQGLGLFAADPVTDGEPLWRFEPGLDQIVSLERVTGLPPAFQAFFNTYAYVSRDFPDGYVLSCGHAKFMNHSDDPNTESRGIVTYARRPIAAGEEITCNYRECCVGWDGFQ